MHRAKKIFWWIVIAFALYAIFTSPDQAANIAHSAWTIIVDSVKNIGHFFDALLQKK